MNDKTKLILVLAGILAVGFSFVLGFWKQPSVSESPSGGFMEELKGKQPLQLPRPEELGTVLPPGAPGPAPDPLVFEKRSVPEVPSRATPGREQKISPPLQEEKKKEGSITPTPEELQELEKKGVLSY
ncbi:MAG: hypothetical protein HY211_03145 [Candidatus Omnitrophica bacterium]|nr:hypothetical protein [Candidatus Omnitrophota bacterium]